MKVIAVEVAARLGMQTRIAATESRATTGEMASAKAAAHMTAAEPAAHMTTAAAAPTRPRVHLHHPRRRAQTRRRSVPR